MITVKSMKEATTYCRMCYNYNEQIISGEEKKADIKRLYKLRDIARQVARRAVRSEYDAIAQCKTCNYHNPKMDNLFRARMQPDSN